MKQILRITIALGLITNYLCNRIQENIFCSYEFDTENCIYDVECIESYDLPFSTFLSYEQLCSVEVTPGVIYQGTNYPQVNLRLSNANSLSSVTGTYGAHIICTLELSFNFLSNYPTIPYMESLHKLNMSHNALKEAVLSNQFELASLVELDLSHNEINVIAINNYHYKYNNLRNLNLANNYIEAIPESAFYSLLQLEYLNLSYNLISSLNVFTFEGLKNILYLDISHNVINELNLSLVRFSKLDELNLSNNQIGHLKINDFNHFVNLKKLDVSSNALLDIEKKMFENMVALQILDLKNNVLNDIEGVGFSNITTLVDVNLSNNRLNKLPVSLFKSSNMSKFSISENYLQGLVAKGTFSGMSLVSEIDLSCEKLTSVEDYAFLGLDIVEVILLNNNNINSIGENSFRGVHNLRTLDLSGNQLTNFDVYTEDLKNLNNLFLHYNFIAQIKKDSFKNMNELNILDLSYNNVSQIQEACFKQLNNLMSLHITNNHLNFTILQESVFTGLKSLPSLDISGITVKVAQNNSFKGMAKLKEVLISHSNVREIQFNTFCNTGAIEILNLTNNKLTSFNINTTDLTNLTTLLLGNNQLIFIAPNIFKRLTRLTFIELSYNNIQSLDENAFSEQKEILRLDLSYNPSLNSIPLIKKCSYLDISGIRINHAPISNNISNDYLIMANSSISNITDLNLKYFNGLEDLILSNNEIVNVEAGSFNNLSTLSKLDLSYNQITVIQPGVFADNANIKILNISHNSLVTINYGIWRGLLNIYTIDISYNNIYDLESEKFYDLMSLGYLIADYNKIKYFNATEFKDSSLVKLSIGNNPIPCQVLSKLRKEDLPFRITALNLNAFVSENVNGIACNSGNDKQNIKENTDNSEILSEIRDILRNITANKTIKPSNKSDIFDKINILEESVIRSALKEDRNKSVDMLHSILKTLIGNSSRNLPTPNVGGNELYADLAPNFKDIKQYMSEINDKLSLMLSQKESSNVANALTANGSETKSLLFLEVCIGSMLFLLIVFILIKFYSSVFKNNRPTLLPRRFSEEIENSDL